MTCPNCCHETHDERGCVRCECRLTPQGIVDSLKELEERGREDVVRLLKDHTIMSSRMLRSHVDLELVQRMVDAKLLNVITMVDGESVISCLVLPGTGVV